MERETGQAMEESRILRFAFETAALNAPAKYHVLADRTIEEIARLEKSGEILVIRPSRNPGIGRMEKRPEKVKEVYELGCEDAVQKLEQVKAFLAASE